MSNNMSSAMPLANNNLATPFSTPENSTPGAGAGQSAGLMQANPPHPGAFAQRDFFPSQNAQGTRNSEDFSSGGSTPRDDSQSTNSSLYSTPRDFPRLMGASFASNVSGGNMGAISTPLLGVQKRPKTSRKAWRFPFTPPGVLSPYPG